LLSRDRLESIEAGAIEILAEIGIEVRHDGIRDAAKRKGVRFRGDRAVFGRQAVQSCIEADRDSNRNAFGQVPDPEPELTLGVSQYSHHRLCHETGAVEPFTTERLIEATKIVDSLASRGVRAGAPGTPMDVHPDLQPLKMYWISAVYARHGRFHADPRSVRSYGYVMDMAEALGRPIRALPVYSFSPLTMGGESLDAVLAFESRIDLAVVLAMPAMGASAPIAAGDAYAMTAAEVIGGAMVLAEATQLEVGWEISMYPSDMREMAMVFGSPENMLLQMASAEVDAFLHGAPFSPGVENIHTMAKEPGPQAAAEKASIMTAGALLGSRHFSHAGTLSLDEVFSDEQLAIDCEIRDHVQRIVGGIDLDTDPATCVDRVLPGLESGYAGADETAAKYRETFWRPALFERRQLGPWLRDGKPELRERARKMVRDALDDYDYELDPTLRRELDAIYARAEREL